MKSETLVQYIDILLNDTEPSAFGEGELYEKYDTPEEISANPPKWVKNKKEWKKIVLDKRHSGYGGAVAHYKRHMHKYFGEDVVRDMIDAYLEESIGKRGKDRDAQERWAFSMKELKSPKKTSSFDELEAHLSYGSEWGKEKGILVKRNGRVTNRYCDGTAGVTREDKQGAEDTETLFHPKTKEETAEWRDVLIDRKGMFLSFA